MTDITITETRVLPHSGFLVYFSSRDSTLVVVANKLGSRFFESFLGHKKKYQKREITCVMDEDTVKILHGFNRKILFYRDPLDRFLGWYRAFVYVPHLTHEKEMLDTHEYEKLSPAERLSILHLGPLLKKAAFKCTLRKSFLENAYNFIMEEDTQELKNLLMSDAHTVPLYSFFQYTNMDPLDYHVLNMSDIGNFTMDRFGSWEKQQPQLSVEASKKSLNMMLELHDKLHVIYKNDYDILSPLVKKYPQEGI